jgi:hypothetical protein
LDTKFVARKSWKGFERKIKFEGFGCGFERKKMEKRNNKGKGSKNQTHPCIVRPNLANIV